MAIQIISDNETFERVIMGVKFTLRRVSFEKAKELNDKHTKMKVNKRTGRQEAYTDNLEAVKDQTDYMIVSWDGDITLDGKKAECNKKNKLNLPDPVLEEIREACEEPTVKEDRIEEEKKTLESGSSLNKPIQS